MGWPGVFTRHPARLLRDPRDVRLGGLPEGGSCVAGAPWDWMTGGDPGARHAPRAIIQALFGLATWSPGLGRALERRPVLVGDVDVVPGDWAETRARLSEAARALRSRCGFSLVVGGDHSITWPLVEGAAGEGSVGILMLDAHYDLRSVESGVTSGSWLWELARRMGGRLHAAIVGVGEYANPPYLHERALRLGFRVVPSHELLGGLEPALEAVDWLAGQAADTYYITVDMDHLQEAYAPGVNSPSPTGLHPRETLEILRHAASRLRPAMADIVEVVPAKDVGGRTVRLAAVVAAWLLGAAGR